jgi:aryl-alcohol dehydrogenase-like predicted oxidoreductase
MFTTVRQELVWYRCASYTPTSYTSDSAMEYRRLGKSGLKLSAFSLGSWVTFARQVDGAGARDMMALAYERGVNFFDNAEVYEKGQSEVLMGEALQRLAWR